MTDAPPSAPAPRPSPRRLLVIRAVLILGALFAIAMGVGLAQRDPHPDDEAPAAASR